MRFLLSINVAFVLTSTPGFGQTVPVDLELAFVVDASGSIDENEKLRRRQGYVEALTHPRIQRAIISGILVRIGVAFIEFSAYGCERLSVQWTTVDGSQSATAFGRKLLVLDYDPCLGGNAAADALAFAAQLIDEKNFEGTRRVIDISGDGPNTLGMSLRGVRRDVLRRDITINALVLERLEMPELPDYFRDEVIGGLKAFMVEAKNHASFSAAILKKI
ncbi:MAG: DUF1194 domain-containing protein [Pseudomonadota bacterium]|nr:DUF1194 domain-containing protein [Pseudomonadota bacterium]